MKDPTSNRRFGCFGGIHHSKGNLMRFSRFFAAVAGVALLAPVTAVSAVSAAPSQLPQSAIGAACTPLLAAQANGERAITELGTKLPEAARRNGITAAELRTQLADSTFWLDECARGFYVEPTATQVGPTVAASTAISPENAFLLNSKPGASRPFISTSPVTT